VRRFAENIAQSFNQPTPEPPLSSPSDRFTAPITWEDLSNEYQLQPYQAWILLLNGPPTPPIGLFSTWAAGRLFHSWGPRPLGDARNGPRYNP